MDSSPLLAILAEWHPRLCAISTQEAEVVVGSKWTRKEFLGHLLDSALNNHQRFVRLQQGDLADFPGYEQEFWVEAGAYRGCDWNELVSLWHLFNRQLAGVIGHIPPGAERNQWKGHGDLRFLVQDYTAHLLHHLHRMRLER